MQSIRELGRRLWMLVHRDRYDRDLEREMRFHLAERADDLIAHGMRPDDARREARRRFGNVGLQSEQTRERDIFAWLDVLVRDLRYAFRSLRAAPESSLRPWRRSSAARPRPTASPDRMARYRRASTSRTA